MSQERIEAAAKVLAAKDRTNLFSWHREEATEALAAADAHDAANKMVRVTWDDLRSVRDEAWQRGYEVSRQGKQPHSPYRAAALGSDTTHQETL